MSRNRQLIINMTASFIAYIITLGISFALSPYIVENVGVDAYGFVGLANNFVSYAGLITIALNSLASRFVTIKIYENDMHGANIYFSSVFIANLVLMVVMGIAGVLLIIFLENLIDLPGNLYWDVKILFSCLFLNCLIGTIGSVFSISTFATNKLYINSIRQIESNILRLVILVPLFLLFQPHVSYIGISALVMGMYVFLFNIYYTKKLLPDIHLKLSYFRIKAVISLIASGVWNLIVRLGQLLLDGLDLLITNIFINATSMGILSVSKLIPSAITGIVSTLVNVFSPNFTILYAQNKRDELLKLVKQSMNIMGVLANIPIIVLIVCGRRFYELWQPTQNATQLYILSLLTCMGLIFNGGINCIYDVFTVVNKLKWNAIGVCITGALSTLTVYILLRRTELGLVAVAGVSSALAIIRNLLFTVPYGAHCLNLKWYTFYPDVIKPVIYVSITGFCGLFIEKYFNVGGWTGVIILGIMMIIIAVIFGFGIILDKNSRDVIISKIKGGK